MHRLLVETELLTEAQPRLPKDALKHLRVLRPEEGERIELFDGKGRWRVYEVEKACEGGERSFQLKSKTETSISASTSNLNLTLFACVTKGSRWDWTIEKATELGVTRIVPVISDRTIVRIPKAERAPKRERWQRIAEDAARQSDAKWLPEIREAVDFKDALSLAKKTTCFVGALTTPPSSPLAEAIQSILHQHLTVTPKLSTFIGPEGDFTPEELSALMAVATPTSFGPTILRAETAAIYALSVLSAICYNIRPS